MVLIFFFCRHNCLSGTPGIQYSSRGDRRRGTSSRGNRLWGRVAGRHVLARGGGGFGSAGGDHAGHTKPQSPLITLALARVQVRNQWQKACRAIHQGRAQQERKQTKILLQKSYLTNSREACARGADITRKKTNKNIIAEILSDKQS